MANLLRWLPALLIPMVIGCGAASNRVQSWAQRHGGVCDFQQERVAVLAQRLVTHCGTGPHDIDVQVLNTDVVAAYSWREGRLFVTRGLVATADDHELAAALAHELAHLLSDGHLKGQVAALTGSVSAESDAESRADLVARELLELSGYQPDAMQRLLVKVAAASSNDSGLSQQHLRRRIAKLAPERRTGN